ncbi:hypothetical protein L226DRAFT_574537 [Lentinus tigrinus ALCF2SS1-7]|uniref:Uncharacterized protein n=1 Tax=Lentinus tigrinus ALCF2SS1-6 TaxID=1328759 RepID=A0A5C2RWY0_9APHY|nr:hypothetical protein L227DRAFT_656930 [Lentinus tigrinus ALCF2SS1-6]RPD70649.1 hypothetical protein L226DRAFT_574537 [Lentinus tigrinus ALCF2SS1-7]
MAADEPTYILCDTYEAASQAVVELSQCSTLIVDCEGRDIGMPGGALSIIAVGDRSGSPLFLFDVLALSDKSHALLAPFLSILRRPDITKVMWDGRADSFEIAETYGVQMGGVLDLQLVEVVQRGRRLRKDGWRRNHTIDYFKDTKDELTADPASLEGIHRVYGLERCLGLYRLIKKGEGKNSEVVAQHGTDVWLQRPLPPTLLEYSAHDIQLIAKLFARFQKKGQYLNDPEALKAMSARYMEVYSSRELTAKHVPLDLCKFVPLEVLAPPKDGVSRFECARCERVLSLASFSTAPVASVKIVDADDAAPSVEREPEPEAQDNTVAKQRLTLCRLCHLVAREKSEADLGEWVAISD